MSQARSGLRSPCRLRRIRSCLAILVVATSPAFGVRAEGLPAHGLRQAGEDFRYLLHKPRDPDRGDRQRLAAVVLTTIVLYGTRNEIRHWALASRTPERDRFLDDVRIMGKGGFAPALALVAWGASFATGEPREKETALLLVESAAYSAAAAGIGQFILATERPEDGNDIRFLRTDGHGVSLDAALAASVVPPLRRQYLIVRTDDGTGVKIWKRAGMVILYGAAILTAFQRINDDKHWAPDAFLGTVTGLEVGETLCEAHGLKSRSRVRVRVAAGRGGGAVLFWTIPLGRPGH